MTDRTSLEQFALAMTGQVRQTLEIDTPRLRELTAQFEEGASVSPDGSLVRVGSLSAKRISMLTKAVLFAEFDQRRKNWDITSTRPDLSGVTAFSEAARNRPQDLIPLLARAEAMMSLTEEEKTEALRTALQAHLDALRP